MKKIDTILFDAGGILIYIDEKRDSIIKRILLSSGYDKKTIENSLNELKKFDDNYFKKNDDFINWKDEKKWLNLRYEFISEKIDPASDELKDKLFCLGLDTFQYKLYDGTIDILEKLKDHYDLVIISNATATLDWCFDLLDLRKYFKEIIISSYEACTKPDEEIYKKTLRRINKRPEQCIFIDDKKENVKTAIKLGIKGIQLKRQEGENLSSLIEILNL